MTPHWKSYWAERPTLRDGAVEELMRQVGKTVLGQPVDVKQLDLLVAHIAKQLDIAPDLAGLDLGCGNGLMTHRLAKGLKRVVGLDYSPVLLASARSQFESPDLIFAEADLMDPSNIAMPEGVYDVAWSIEVLQNLTPAALTGLLSRLRGVTSPDFRFLASGIPDIARIRDFYNTEERWQRHLEQESIGQDPIGYWWSAEELAESARKAGFVTEIRALPPDYYTAHYRFEALFRKQGP